MIVASNILETDLNILDIAMMLETDLNDAVLCFEQSIGLATLHELRCLFAALTINGFPTLGIWYHNGLKRELLRDRLERPRTIYTPSS